MLQIGNINFITDSFLQASVSWVRLQGRERFKQIQEVKGSIVFSYCNKTYSV